ncbi:hypothetical protein [Azospirillum sp. B506]|nr:hypothetical protein [Azospirillum sp. B506]
MLRREMDFLLRICEELMLRVRNMSAAPMENLQHFEQPNAGMPAVSAA